MLNHSAIRNSVVFERKEKCKMHLIIIRYLEANIPKTRCFTKSHDDLRKWVFRTKLFPSSEADWSSKHCRTVWGKGEGKFRCFKAWLPCSLHSLWYWLEMEDKMCRWRVILCSFHHSNDPLTDLCAIKKRYINNTQTSYFNITSPFTQGTNMLKESQDLADFLA